MKKLITILLLLMTFNAFSQDWPLKKLVQEKKAGKVSFKAIPAFSFVNNKAMGKAGTYQQLSLNPDFTRQLLEQKPAAIRVNIPTSSTTSISCDLVKFSLGNIVFTENDKDVIENVKVPVTYRGIIAGMTEKNTVILTVNDEYLSLIANKPDGAIQVTKAGETNTAAYNLYNSNNIQFPAPAPFDCGTMISESNQASKIVSGIDLTGIQLNPLAAQDKCVNVFVDCFDSVYIWQKSNQQQVVYYVYELFNIVAGGYLNEQINIQITTINIWTTATPYRRNSRENALYDLAAKWQDNFWGNICVGLDYSVLAKGRSGIAGGIGKVKGTTANTCPVYSAKDSVSACCYNDLNYNVTVKNFPTTPNVTQPQVYLVMHEMGHLLGARHTKWCGWKLTSNPDTFGPIDSCGVIEAINNSTPPCPQGPPPPANGATIMSYCVGNNSANDFVSYTNGFGPLPGNAIRNFVDQNACLLTCVECFGLRSNSNKDLYAFQNINTALKKERGKGENSRRVPLNKPSCAGDLLIISKKIK